MPDRLRKLAIASQNPVKTRATLNGFLRMFPGQTLSIDTISVPSHVRAQPMTNAETLQGAMNRAHSASLLMPQADYWVGIEGGLEELEDELLGFAWAVVLSGTQLGKGRTAGFVLPQRVSSLIREGLELGEADDRVFDRLNSKQENGAVGILTGNAIDRAEAYAIGVILALAPFKNPQYYFS
jgi:inosine/xanthosine triphosphatase